MAGRISAGTRDQVRAPRRWARAALAIAVVVVFGLDLAVAARLGGPASLGSTSHAAAPPVLRITPTPGSTVNPTVPIVVHVTGGALGSVTATNTASGAAIPGALSPDATTWRSTATRAYGTTIHITATATGPDGTAAQQTANLTTLTPAAQAYPSMTPAPGAEANFGVGQIIGVSFDHDVTDQATAQNALSVTSNPPQPGSWYWMDKRTAHYRPQSYWQPGSTITLRANLYGINLGHGVYGQTDRSATYTVHDSWIARADGATEQMRIFHNGQLDHTMPMSLGSPGFPSHSGPHVISDKQPTITMDSCTYGVCPGQPGYYREQVALDERISNDGEFVHSAPWSVGQQGNSNVSHGCVNLSPSNAQWFYNHFGLGDVVEISNSGGPPLPVWDTYGDWALPWTQWTAGNPPHS